MNREAVFLVLFGVMCLFENVSSLREAGDGKLVRHSRTMRALKQAAGSGSEEVIESSTVPSTTIAVAAATAELGGSGSAEVTESSTVPSSTVAGIAGLAQELGGGSAGGSAEVTEPTSTQSPFQMNSVFSGTDCMYSDPLWSTCRFGNEYRVKMLTSGGFFCAWIKYETRVCTVVIAPAPFPGQRIPPPPY